MENLSWAGQPIQQFLDKSPNSAHVTQVANALTEALVQATKFLKRDKLREQLEKLLQQQYLESDDTFRAKIQLEPLQSCELATKHFQHLGGVGMVLYGYIHHTDGLEEQVLELDDKDKDILIRSIGDFLEAEKEQEDPGVLGIYFWVSIKKDITVYSGTLVLY
jgi:hypothetical protein